MPAKVVTQTYRDDVPVSAIKPHPMNPRRGKTAAIGESIEENGFYGSCLVQKRTGFILIGEHRWRAAQDEGLKAIPVTYADVDDATALRIMLADNRTSDMADYDSASLLDVLQTAERSNTGLAGTGYSSLDVDALLDSLGVEGGDEDAGPGSSGHGGGSYHGEDDDYAPFGDEGAGNGSKNNIDQLVVGKWHIPLTPTEANALAARVQAHVDQTGTLYGFVNWLLGL